MRPGRASSATAHLAAATLPCPGAESLPGGLHPLAAPLPLHLTGGGRGRGDVTDHNTMAVPCHRGSRPLPVPLLLRPQLWAQGAFDVSPEVAGLRLSCLWSPGLPPGDLAPAASAVLPPGVCALHLQGRPRNVWPLSAMDLASSPNPKTSV